MTETTTSAEAIERDIEQTQNSISETVEQLQRRLNPRSLIDAVLGDEEDSAQRLLTAARDNPLGVGLLGLGALLLASGKSPSLSGLRDSFGKQDSGTTGSGSSIGSKRQSWRGSSRDDGHASYLTHMARVEYREGEDDLAYQRRRDYARADYFMIDRNHDEDDSGFRARLNEAQEKLRQRTSAFADKARRASHDAGDTLDQARSAFAAKTGDAMDSATEFGRQASDRINAQYQSNPAIGGLIAAAIGAAFGAALPTSQIEQRKLGALGEQARDIVSEQKDKAIDLLSEQKEKVVEKAHAALDDVDTSTQSNATSPSPAYTGVTSTQA